MTISVSQLGQKYKVIHPPSEYNKLDPAQDTQTDPNE